MITQAGVIILNQDRDNRIEMIKLLKMTGIFILALVILVIISLILFLNFAPQIGAKPDGNRLERMKSSENFKLGKFHNTVTTKMDMKSGKMLGVMLEFFKNDDSREPGEMLQTHKFSALDFNDLSSDKLSFTWFGHSSILIKIDGKVFLIDPVFSERASMFSFMGPKRFPYSNYMNVDLLPEIDAVLISHDHYDHLDYKTMLKLKDKVNRFYVPLSVGAHLEKWGISSKKIVELNWWDSTDLGSISLVFTPSRHFSGRGLNNRFSTLWGSWVILGQNQRIFFGGDSGYFPGFKKIGEKYGPFKLAFLECGAYNENWSEIHMMPEETVQASLDLKSKLLMPIHWGKFNLALHPWKEPIQRAIKKGEELNVNIITPEIGELVILEDQLKTAQWWKRYQ
jgi:L-ascorbate metabolism protein UlaG (beta-lactamase superfamily)